MKLSFKKIILAATTSLSIFCPFIAGAEWRPQRPVNIVMPFAPGGGTDIILRHLQAYGERHRIIFTPDYRSGAEGFLAMRHGASQRGDGYSLTIGTVATMAHQRDGFDAVRSFDQLTGLRGTIFFLVTNNNIRSFDDLLMIMRNPSINVAVGSGAPSQRIVIEDLINFFAPNSTNPIVNYRGTSGVIQDLIGRHIQWGLIPGSTAMPVLRSGSINVVATEAPRDQSGVDVPMISEYMPSYQRHDFSLIAMPHNSNADAREFWLNWFRTYVTDPEVMQEVRQTQSLILPFGPDNIIQAVESFRQRQGIQ